MSEHTASQPRYLDGDKLRAARVSAGMRQSDLASLAGVSRGNLHHHEAKHWGCEPDLLVRYATALGKQPEDLMRDEVLAGTTAGDSATSGDGATQ